MFFLNTVCDPISYCIIICRWQVSQNPVTKSNQEEVEEVVEGSNVNYSNDKAMNQDKSSDGGRSGVKGSSGGNRGGVSRSSVVSSGNGGDVDSGIKWDNSEDKSITEKKKTKREDGTSRRSWTYTNKEKKKEIGQ